MSVNVEDEGSVRIVTLNRPERSNAISSDMSQAFGQAMSEAESREDIHAIVITGTGDRSFCAGMDLAEFLAKSNDKTIPEVENSNSLGLATLTERAYPKPVIAAVNGAAVGGGFGLVLACDIVIAAAHATFAIPEVRRGLVGVGVTSRATQRIPIGVVLHLALTGNSLDAETARTFGIVNEVLPSGDELTRAVTLAHQIAEYSPLAVRAAKQVVYTTARLIDGVDMQALRKQARNVQSSKAALEGARAFVERTESQR